MTLKAPFRLPADFLRTFGYPGRRRFVEPARHWLIADALTGEIHAAPRSEAHALLLNQQLPG